MKAKKPKDTQIRKSILYTVKIIQFISIDLVTKLASMIFTTPIKHKMPNSRKATRDYLGMDDDEKS